MQGKWTHRICFFEQRCGERLEFCLHFPSALVRDVSLFPSLGHFFSRLPHSRIDLSLFDEDSSGHHVSMLFHLDLKLEYASSGCFQFVSRVLQGIVESCLVVDCID